MLNHIVMSGDPVSGFVFFGPFTRDEAYAEFGRLEAAVGKVAAVWVVPLTGARPVAHPKMVEALQLGLDAMNTLDYRATLANREFVVAAREALRCAGEEPRA